AAAAPAPAPSAQIHINLESPAAGALLNNGQTVTLTGWAVDGSGSGSGVDAVRIFLDGQADGGGQALGFANYGKTRTDVVTASGNPDWSRSGFDLTWPVAGISPGSHLLYVYAHSVATGQWDYTTVPVTVTSAGTSSPPAAGGASGATSA